jgi:hypothetical protein
MTEPTPTPPPADARETIAEALLATNAWSAYDVADSIIAALTEAGYAIAPKQAGITLHDPNAEEWEYPEQFPTPSGRRFWVSPADFSRSDSTTGGWGVIVSDLGADGYAKNGIWLAVDQIEDAIAAMRNVRERAVFLAKEYKRRIAAIAAATPDPDEDAARSDETRTWIKWDETFQQWRGPNDDATLRIESDGHITMISGNRAGGMRIAKEFDMGDLKMMIREVLDEYDLPRRKPPESLPVDPDEENADVE